MNLSICAARDRLCAHRLAARRTPVASVPDHKRERPFRCQLRLIQWVANLETTQPPDLPAQRCCRLGSAFGEQTSRRSPRVVGQCRTVSGA